MSQRAARRALRDEKPEHGNVDLISLVRDASRWLAALVVAHQYVGLFIVIALEEAGVPLPAPGDVVIAYYGNRARGDFPELAQVVLVCAAASTAGTLGPYWLARHFGERGVERFARWVDVDPRRLDTVRDRVARHGFWAVLVGRLIPGLRVAMSVIAGAALVPPLSFSAAIFIAGSIYWTLWVALGALLGPTIGDFLERAHLRYVVVVFPLLFVAYLVFRHVRASRRHRAEDAARGAATG